MYFVETEHSAAARFSNVQQALLTLSLHQMPLKRLMQELNTQLHCQFELVSPFDQHDFYDVFDHIDLPTAFSILESKTSYVVIPVNSKHTKPFYAVVKNASLSEINAINEYAKLFAIISLTIIQRDELERQQARFEEQTFRQFLTHPTSENALLYAEKWALKHPFVSIFVHVESDVFSKTRTSVWDFYLFAKAYVATKRSVLTVFPYDQGVFILCPVPEISAWQQNLETFLNDLETRFLKRFHLHVDFGISSVAVEESQLHKVCEESQHAASRKTVQSIRYYTEQSLFDLFEMVPMKVLKQFADRTFSSFERLEQAERDVLLETLDSYLENHCQVSETAKQLFLHRNTILYRLEKCKTLLDVDLKDGETTLQLRVALRIYKQLYPALQGGSL